jgi:hypothetical protein
MLLLTIFLVIYYGSVYAASLRKRVDEDGDPSVLLPKKKRKKDQKVKINGTKRKRRTKKMIEQEKLLLSSSSSSASYASPRGGGSRSSMSDMFDKHLPLRKRARLLSAGTTESGKSTPVRPQKSEGASMLLGMAAILANQNNATVATSAVPADIRSGVNVATKSGAKMLADAQFLVSLGGPAPSLLNGPVNSPSGSRTLVEKSSESEQ